MAANAVEPAAVALSQDRLPGQAQTGKDAFPLLTASTVASSAQCNTDTAVKKVAAKTAKQPYGTRSGKK